MVTGDLTAEVAEHCSQINAQALQGVFDKEKQVCSESDVMFFASGSLTRRHRVASCITANTLDQGLLRALAGTESGLGLSLCKRECKCCPDKYRRGLWFVSASHEIAKEPVTV